MIVRKFWKKIPFSSLEMGWFLFLLTVFVPVPNFLHGIAEFAMLILFLIVNLFWFIPLIYYYGMREKNQLTSYFYGVSALMIIVAAIAIAGWYDVFWGTAWMPITDVARGVAMGFSLIYCGYLVNSTGSTTMTAKRYEYYSLILIGAGTFAHGLYHILVYGFGTLHDFEEIAAAAESTGAYFAAIVEFIAFGVVAIGFILMLINTTRHADYRPEINSGQITATSV